MYLFFVKVLAILYICPYLCVCIGVSATLEELDESLVH